MKSGRMCFILKTVSLVYFLLPLAEPYSCELDYDSPHLNILFEPRQRSMKDFRNFTITCSVRPYEDGFLVRHSSLEVKRDSDQRVMGDIDDYALISGSYNLTIHLEYKDIANETSLTVTCRASMLSQSCSNVTIKLFLYRNHSKMIQPSQNIDRFKGKSLHKYEIVGLVIGALAVVLAIIFALKIRKKYFLYKNSINESHDPLTPELAKPATWKLCWLVDANS